MRHGLGRSGWPIAAAAAVFALSGCQSLPRLPRFQQGLVATPPACADFAISIYFDAGSYRITREADALIRTAAARTRGCAVSTVDVVGLADAPGDPDANLALSKRRGDTVTEALARRGFGAVTFEVAAAGDAGAQTSSGAARPLRRRADVLFHVAPGR